MEPQPHKLQQDPPEGDRDLIDRELARQEKREGQGVVKAELSGAAKKPGQPPDSERRATEELRGNAEDDTGSPAKQAKDGGKGTGLTNRQAMDQAAPQTGVRPGP